MILMKNEKTSRYTKELTILNLRKGERRSILGKDRFFFYRNNRLNLDDTTGPWTAPSRQLVLDVELNLILTCSQASLSF